MKRLVTLHKDTLQNILKEHALRSKEARHLHRLHCVSLVAQGHGCADVAHWFGETPRTIQRWVRAYQQGGVDALCDDARSGRPPRLAQSQWLKLQVMLRRPPREAGYDQDIWDSGLVRRHLMEVFNLRFSIRQCQRLLRIIQHEIAPPVRRHDLKAEEVSEI